MGLEVAARSGYEGDFISFFGSCGFSVQINHGLVLCRISERVILSITLFGLLHAFVGFSVFPITAKVHGSPINSSFVSEIFSHFSHALKFASKPRVRCPFKPLK